MEKQTEIKIEHVKNYKDIIKVKNYKNNLNKYKKKQDISKIISKNLIYNKIFVLKEINIILNYN